MVVSPNPEPFHSLTSIPTVFVSVSEPQEKIPLVQVSLPVVASQVWSPEPKSWEDDAYDVFSKGTDVDVPVVSKTVLPIERLAVVKAILVTASTVKVLVNSSKSNEFEVTLRPVKLRVLVDQVKSVPAVILLDGVS